MNDLTVNEMKVIGLTHGITPAFRREFLKLANEGRIDNKQFGIRLHTCDNYRAACSEIMSLLAKRARA